MRIARRFMPRIKTESEVSRFTCLIVGLGMPTSRSLQVATLEYIRSKTNVPIPEVYHYESNQYNELEAEYIIMSKVRTARLPSPTRVLWISQAEGVPLLRVHRSMDSDEKRQLLSNLASHMLTLFKHRFNSIGSLYSSSNPPVPPSVPQTPSVSRPGTPRLRARSNLGVRPPISRLPSSPSGSFAPPSPSSLSMAASVTFTVGPIVSWPFFGEGRGLQHLDRGPWSSFEGYLFACCEREIDAVRKESEGRVHSHRPHRPPEAGTSAPSSSDEEEEDDGEIYYRDYRTMQRSSLLVSYAFQRVEAVRSEMDQLKKYLRNLGVGALKRDELDAFSFDLHDLSLANIFVDEDDHSQIVSDVKIVDQYSPSIDLHHRLGVYLHSTLMAVHTFTSFPDDESQRRRGNNVPRRDGETGRKFIESVVARRSRTNRVAKSAQGSGMGWLGRRIGTKRAGFGRGKHEWKCCGWA